MKVGQFVYSKKYGKGIVLEGPSAQNMYRVSFRTLNSPIWIDIGSLLGGDQ